MSKGWNYRAANWNIICDVCGIKYKASDSKFRWDGLITCPKCFEHRHPQDYLKARPDKITVPYLRPQPTVADETFVTMWCDKVTQQGKADTGVADCALADHSLGCTFFGRGGVAGSGVTGCAIAGNLLEGYL